jgi:hypothetical protein
LPAVLSLPVPTRRHCHQSLINHFYEQESLARSCVLFESGLIAGIRQALRGGDTGGWATRQTFGANENSDRRLVIVLSHDFLLSSKPHGTCCSLRETLKLQSLPPILSVW